MLWRSTIAVIFPSLREFLREYAFLRVLREFTGNPAGILLERNGNFSGCCGAIGKCPGDTDWGAVIVCFIVVCSIQTSGRMGFHP
jgi:hypothetical protein